MDSVVPAIRLVSASGQIQLLAGRIDFEESLKIFPGRWGDRDLADDGEPLLQRFRRAPLCPDLDWHGGRSGLLTAGWRIFERSTAGSPLLWRIAAAGNLLSGLGHVAGEDHPFQPRIIIPPISTPWSVQGRVYSSGKDP
jgi:hypothetical protein